MNTDPVITLAEFETGTIEADAFDHEAHVYTAWLMLESCELPEAIRRYDAALRQLTSRLGVPEKYHATITWLFLVLINQRRTTDQSWEEFRERNSDLIDGSRSTLARYYSEALLFSDAARQHFVLPDRLAS